VVIDMNQTGTYGHLNPCHFQFFSCRGTVLQDNINPITKVEKTSVLLASVIHDIPPSRLLANKNDVERLSVIFPALMET